MDWFKSMWGEKELEKDEGIEDMFWQVRLFH